MLNITQTWWPDDIDQMGHMAEVTVFQSDPELSQLLGPDGEPLEYERHPFGFDLSSKGAEQ